MFYRLFHHVPNMLIDLAKVIIMLIIVQDIINFQNANFATLIIIYKLIENTIVMLYFKVGENLA